MVQLALACSDEFCCLTEKCSQKVQNTAYSATSSGGQKAFYLCRLLSVVISTSFNLQIIPCILLCITTVDSQFTLSRASYEIGSFSPQGFTPPLLNPQSQIFWTRLLQALRWRLGTGLWHNFSKIWEKSQMPAHLPIFIPEFSHSCVVSLVTLLWPCSPQCRHSTGNTVR